MADSKKSKKDEYPFHYALMLKLFPSYQQEKIIMDNIYGARFYYNFLVAQDNKLHKIGKEPNVFVSLISSRRQQILEETYGQLKKKIVTDKHGNLVEKFSREGKLNYVKDTFPWMRNKNLDSLMFENVILNHQTAWDNCLKYGRGIPKFHKKSYEGSYQTNAQYQKFEKETGLSLFKGNVRFDEQLTHIQLPKLGFVKVKYSKKLLENILELKDVKVGTVTICKTATDEFFCSLQLASKHPFVDAMSKLSASTEDTAVGIDLNVKNFLTDTNNKVVDNPKYYRRIEYKLNYAKRKMSKRQARAKKEKRPLAKAKNYQKQRLLVARLSRKVTNQRKNFLHELAKAYLKNHEIVVAEELRSKNLLKNHKIAKSLQDVGHRTFLTLLEQKAQMYGRTFVTVNPKNTTQTCSACGHIMSGKDKLTLKDREWTCPVCHTYHDRDYNASVNILKRGLENLAS